MQTNPSSPGQPPLLTTKLHVPPPRRDVVPRPELFARLNAGLNRKLTLVSAPAGFGKTTLVSEWVAASREQTGAPLAAWVALDAGDNDPVRFWRYVITACQAFGAVSPEAAVGQSALALLQTAQRPAQQPAWEDMLTLLINDLAQLPGNGILVLEDYHVISAPQVHETLIFLIDNLPATLHLIITTRSDPPLPLARLRAHSDLNELRADDLRFSLAETQALLQPAVAYPLAAQVIERLEARTEGWVTGLRLVALMVQGKADPQAVEQLLATFTGSHGHLFNYFIAEVLDAQPVELQEFLLRTSVLTRLTGSLCNAVTGRDDSEMVLERLQQANMFLMPLDNAGEWYRYHALFAEALHHEARRRLGEETLRALAQAASQWYEVHGLLTEAVEAALAAQNFPSVADLLERCTAPELVQNEYHTLRRWIEQLPDEELRAHPALCMTYAMAILFTSDRSSRKTMTLLEPPLLIAEQYWRATENGPKLGEALALRALAATLQGDWATGFRDARQALVLLPEGETQWRASTLPLVAMQELLAGKLNMARQTLTQALALSRAARNIYGILVTTLALGDVCAGQGQLHQAEQFDRQVLSEAEQASMNRRQVLIRIGGARLGLGALALEWNDLEAAEQNATEAVTIGQQMGYDELRVQGSLILAHIKLVRGKKAEAQELLQTLSSPIRQQRWLFLIQDVSAYQARLALAAGDLVSAERLIASAQPGDGATGLQQEQAALLVARLCIARGDAEEALRALESRRGEAHAEGRAHSELVMNVVQSLAHFARQDMPQAKAALLRALTQARAEGYQRLFLDEGEAMVSLLREVWPDVKDEPLAGYVRSLIIAFVQAQPAGVPSSRAEQSATSALETAFLTEPLSPQERRVLHLLVMGLSNAEMARQLSVSINTIKSQVQNIYRKLNVNNRQAACDAAHHLNLG